MPWRQQSSLLLHILRGACFGYKVIDLDAFSTYFQNNYSLVTNGDMRRIVGDSFQCEIVAGLLREMQWPCVHPFGADPK